MGGDAPLIQYSPFRILPRAVVSLRTHAIRERLPAPPRGVGDVDRGRRRAARGTRVFMLRDADGCETGEDEDGGRQARVRLVRPGVRYPARPRDPRVAAVLRGGRLGGRVPAARPPHPGYRGRDRDDERAAPAEVSRRDHRPHGLLREDARRGPAAVRGAAGGRVQGRRLPERGPRGAVRHHRLGALDPPPGVRGEAAAVRADLRGARAGRDLRQRRPGGRRDAVLHPAVPRVLERVPRVRPAAAPRARGGPGHAGTSSTRTTRSPPSSGGSARPVFTTSTWCTGTGPSSSPRRRSRAGPSRASRLRPVGEPAVVGRLRGPGTRSSGAPPRPRR